jgi:hypothetical protein
MPQMTMPGTTSRVRSTTASSAVFMSSAPMPGRPEATRPRRARRLTPDAPMGPSWPVDETMTRDSITLGSLEEERGTGKYV